MTPGDGSPMVSVKTGRNEKCKCGSGKKQKNCCGVKTKYYSTKPFMPTKKKEDSGIIAEKGIKAKIDEMVESGDCTVSIP